METIRYKNYDLVIIRKKIKHTYLRVSEKKEVVITTSLSTKPIKIYQLIDKNQHKIDRMIAKQIEPSDIYILGRKYQKIKMPTLNKVEIDADKVFYNNDKVLEKWYRNLIKEKLSELLIENYQRFNENIPYPQLKIRKMKTRWGVCNIKQKTLTLNSQLMQYDKTIIDYVIIHELAHFVVNDHSKRFWQVVSVYCPDYLQKRRVLKL